MDAIRFFINENGKLIEKTIETGLPQLNGQWRSLATVDVDKDGDMDLVAGNLGLNNKYRLSAKHPLELFAGDLDGNGSIDPVMAYYMKNEKGEMELFPSMSRQQFAAQVPIVKKQFLLNADYSVAGIDKIFNGMETENMMKLPCFETRSVWLENKGNGKFEIHALPVEAQFSPVNTVLCTDVDGDGNADIILAGNEYQAEVGTGRYDASYGLLMKGDGNGNFKTFSAAQSGLIIDGDVKDIKLVTLENGERILIVGINDEKLKAFKIK